MTLGQIIRAYREENSMSMDSFAKASGLSKGYISQLENNLNPKTGEPPVPSVNSIKKAANGMFMSFDELFSQLNDNMKVSVSPEKVKMAKKAIRIPLLGNVAAGIPIEAIEDIIDYEEISEELAHTGDFFALKIKGDSMEPRICIRIIPFNQAYEPLFYSNEEIENKPVRIIGKVVENRQKY